MHNKNNVIQYYLFSFSNFIAALGGGMILGKGVGIINEPFLKGGSVLAFFTGTVFGLLFIQLVPKKISTLLIRLFSIFSGATSFILLMLFEYYAKNEQLQGVYAFIFFFLLTIRFGFWFYSRALRASAVANQNQSIVWVEIGYYAGIILGLIIWSFPGVKIGYANALIIDVFLQLFAGFIDIYANFISTNLSPLQNNIKIKKESVFNETCSEKYWIWRLIIALVFLTTGTQAIIFGLAQRVPSNFSSFVMASFYMGVFIAALVYKKNNIYLEWNQLIANNVSHAMICANRNGKKNQYIFYFFVSLQQVVFYYPSAPPKKYHFF